MIRHDLTPGCETCSTHGSQCLDCDAEDRTGLARCTPTWCQRQDLLAGHAAHVTTGRCMAPAPPTVAMLFGGSR